MEVQHQVVDQDLQVAEAVEQALLVELLVHLIVEQAEQVLL
tara:strand:- start:230 stop:352 length:123 start_codon:yes stop_codon:yes gene_type:complete